MRWLTAITAVGAVALLAGCGSEDGPAGRGPAAGTVDYGSFGTTATIDCADGRSVNVAGSNNRLSISGRCESIRVGGADNRITIEQIDGELAVTGLNNTITYVAGEPAVSDSGAGNRISRG